MAALAIGQVADDERLHRQAANETDARDDDGN